MALTPPASSQSSGRGLAQEAEALKADLEVDAWALSHPGCLGQRDSGGATAGEITAYMGGEGEGGKRMGPGCHAVRSAQACRCDGARAWYGKGDQVAGSGCRPPPPTTLANP